MQPARRVVHAALRTPWRPFTVRANPSPILRAASAAFHPQPPCGLRYNSSTPAPNTYSGPLPHKPAPHRNPDEPIYQLTFTCKVCKDRSSHTVSKQGYHKGSVLISCPGCKNRHLIADHLKIFSDESTTIEEIMKSQGEEVQRGRINMDGDVEFWKQDAEPQGEK